MRHLVLALAIKDLRRDKLDSEIKVNSSMIQAAD